MNGCTTGNGRTERNRPDRKRTPRELRVPKGFLRGRTTATSGAATSNAPTRRSITSTAVSIRRIRKETASDSASPSPKNKKFTFLPGVRDSLPRGSRIFRIRLFPGPEQVSGERSGQPDGPADGQHPPRKTGRASQNTAPTFGVVFRCKLPIIGDCRFFGLPLPLCSELCGARRNIY